MSSVSLVASSKLPTPWGIFCMVGFRELATGKDHVALTMGDITSADPVLGRIHSECLTGDALFSLRCDCGFQLQAAMQRIAREFNLSETAFVLPPKQTFLALLTYVLLGCIGLPVPSTDIQIRDLEGREVAMGEAGELFIKGPQVMKGYWNRPEDTARTISPEGWLGTGDQAEIVDGRIRILGRIKEIIVTSTGEKVPPGDLELAITADPLLEQAFVVGEQRPFIACIATVRKDEWRQLAEALGLDPEDPASLADPTVQRAVLDRIERRTSSFARYAVPRAVHLVRDAWTIDNGLMTPTLKLKRNNLMARYGAAIEAIYQKR